jgi:S1-C subfamily serine protease
MKNQLKSLIYLSFLSLFLFSTNELKSQCQTSRSAYEGYFINKLSEMNLIEGVWQLSTTTRIMKDGKVKATRNPTSTKVWGIIKDGDVYRICDINGKKTEFDSYFTSTEETGIYQYTRSKDGQTITAKTNVSKMYISYNYKVPADEAKEIVGEEFDETYEVFREPVWKRLYPTEEMMAEFQSSTGTGMAINNAGYIFTCQHVINKAKKIKVRGINGDFSKTYNARIIAEDKNNDIAIIKIDESGFKLESEPPFAISNKSSDVGINVYTLGYPKLEVMGSEVKLTNGIISSRSGYKGDVTAYQISAPVQPGNSGGPLFDNKGNLIGVVNAKIVDADNVSYAVKSYYLNTLIDMFEIKLPDAKNSASVLGKELSEQIKFYKNFIYILEVN